MCREKRIKDTYFEPDERKHSRKLFVAIFKGLGVPLVPLLVSLVDQCIYLGKYLVSRSSPLRVGANADLSFQVLLDCHLIFNIKRFLLCGLGQSNLFDDERTHGPEL